QLGTNSSSTDKCALTIDASSNVYVTGLYIGTVDFDPGPASYTMTTNGNPDIFVLKIDAAGNFTWAKTMGGISSDGGIAITLDAANNIYTTGYFFGTADFDPSAATFNLTSAGSNDIFISKLDASGNFGWAVRLGGGTTDYVNCIASDATGNVYLTSGFSGVIDFDPGPGIFNLADNGAADIFIFKMHQQPLSLNENINDELIHVYPNPTANILKLSGYSFSKNSNYIISDFLGQKLLESKLEDEINLSTLKNGIYYLQVFENEKLIACKKIIKE
ncbi:MAG: T9SS type A sorting domain-containing protein, partial [Bacteroidetes bacterium]|nr:T9SS type A sorting domain-containing protein [Bacteroidota bacterium]